MEKKSFTATIEVEKTPEEVFNCIKEVTKWWSKDFEGSCTNLNDEFVIHHPHAHYSNQKLIEVMPDKKIVWFVTDSTLHWLEKDKHEWTNTKMIFEIIPHGSQTRINFTYNGPVRDNEQERLVQICDLVIKDKLYHFIMGDKA